MAPRRVVARPVVAATLAVALSVVVGITAIALHRDEMPSPAAVIDTGSAGALQDPVTPVAVPTRTDATATRVQIPAIAVDSVLVPFALRPDTSQLQPPVDFDKAGWYSGGTVPGDIGPAVIDGHIDSAYAPGVFARLSELVDGDQILVTLSNGEVKTFEVTTSLQGPKNDFPTDEVYRATPTAQLRLITCDGQIDPSTGLYLDNLIVFAELVA